MGYSQYVVASFSPLTKFLIWFLKAKKNLTNWGHFHTLEGFEDFMPQMHHNLDCPWAGPGQPLLALALIFKGWAGPGPTLALTLKMKKKIINLILVFNITCKIMTKDIK